LACETPQERIIGVGEVQWLCDHCGDPVPGLIEDRVEVTELEWVSECVDEAVVVVVKKERGKREGPRWYGYLPVVF